MVAHDGSDTPLFEKGDHVTSRASDWPFLECCSISNNLIYPSSLMATAPPSLNGMFLITEGGISALQKLSRVGGTAHHCTLGFATS
eukprot:2213708-Amphidinium_carterae.1